MASSTNTTALPEPKDLSYHFSRTTKNRAQSQMKAFYKYFSIPGIGNLAGGERPARRWSNEYGGGEC